MSSEPASAETNDPPAEVMGTTPRAPRLTGTGWLNLIAGSFFSLLGVAGAIYFFGKSVTEAGASRWWLSIFPLWLVLFGGLLVRRFPLERRLAIEGILSSGCVTGRKGEGPSRGPLIVNYTFRIANDEVEIGSCPSDSPLTSGSAVWILYLPSNPRKSAIYPLDLYRIDQ